MNDYYPRSKVAELITQMRAHPHKDIFSSLELSMMLQCPQSAVGAYVKRAVEERLIFVERRGSSAFYTLNRPGPIPEGTSAPTDGTVIGPVIQPRATLIHPKPDPAPEVGGIEDEEAEEEFKCARWSDGDVVLVGAPLTEDGQVVLRPEHLEVLRKLMDWNTFEGFELGARTGVPA